MQYTNMRLWRLLLLAAAVRLVVCEEGLSEEGRPEPEHADTTSRESVILRLDRYATLQDCYNALPETGGTILFPANTTTILTSSVVFTKPNVTLRGEGWDTVILRDERAGPCLLEVGGVHSTVADLTIDGNGEHCPDAKVELRMKGNFATVRHVQLRNPRKMGIGLKSNGGLVTDCLITGLGPKGLSSYGIWAIANTTVTITGNTIRDTFIDGIGLDGKDCRVINNTLSNCHHDPSIGGGQIVVYPHSLGVLIQGNTIDRGGNRLSGGLELNGNETSVINNTILNQTRYGIQLHSPKGDEKVYGFTISGNIIRDCGQPGKWKNQAISVSPHVSQVAISGNTINTEKPDKDKLVGINLFGNNDKISITDNIIKGYRTPVAVGPEVGPDLVLANNSGATTANVEPHKTAGAKKASEVP